MQYSDVAPSLSKLFDCHEDQTGHRSGCPCPDSVTHRHHHVECDGSHRETDRPHPKLRGFRNPFQLRMGYVQAWLQTPGLAVVSELSELCNLLAKAVKPALEKPICFPLVHVQLVNDEPKVATGDQSHVRLTQDGFDLS